MKTRALIAFVLLATAATAQQPLRKSIRSEQKFALAPGGTFILENPSGNVEIVGDDVSEVVATIVTAMTAANNENLQEARRQSGLLIGGDDNTRIVRTAIAPHKNRPWSVKVHWSVRVPRRANVRVISGSSDRIRIVNLDGGVNVTNFNGNIILTNVLGAARAESVNGSIIYSTPRPRGNVLLSTVNGHVTATIDAGQDFRWIAETVTGEIRTNLQPRGAFFGATFRGSINAPGGPTITTRSLMGNTHMLAAGSSATTSKSLRAIIPAPQMSSSQSQRGLRREIVEGFFRYETSIGDVRVQEVRGDASVTTGAGEVQLGAVSGSATVRSNGGPMQLGDITGPLIASTRAGDILVDRTRSGGTITTEGGTIRLLYTGGPTRLRSGGGDVTVRQAAAPVDAATSSGDITITVDPRSKTQVVSARTDKGNVVLIVNDTFRADVDATIITSNPNADTITSDIPGLSISRHQVGGRTHIRAVGRLNGGGQKVMLQSTGGDIRISTGKASKNAAR